MADPELLPRALALPGLGRLRDLPGVHLVGGAVRDLLAGRKLDRDLDLVVEGELEPVLALLGGEAEGRHERFGTASVRWEGRRYDLVRARTETYARPGALPDVEPAPIDDDLRRRDFTVNALALALTDGTLRSVPGAEEDVADRVLRVLHPRSFEDDPTRLLRLARYAARLGFAVEPETRAWAEAAVHRGALDTVSSERIATELKLFVHEDDPLAAFAVLRSLGVERPGVEDPDQARRALALLPADGRRDVLLLDLVAGAGREAQDLRGLDAAEVAERLESAEQAAIAGACGGEAEARRWLDETRHVALAINGDDLRRAGVEPGPELGAALGEVLRRKRRRELPGGRDAELAAALAILGR